MGSSIHINKEPSRQRIVIASNSLRRQWFRCSVLPAIHDCTRGCQVNLVSRWELVPDETFPSSADLRTKAALVTALKVEVAYTRAVEAQMPRAIIDGGRKVFLELTVRAT